mgnify:CR=1 FL=1
MVKTKEKLVIIAEDVVGEALSALVVNKMRGVLDICAMKAPGFGVRRKDLLQDIAIATGATYVAQEVGVSLETVTPEMLGTCERMVIGKEETTIVTDGKQAEAMEKRIQQIRTEAENTDSQFDKEKAEERVAALGGGIARIKVGAATETELKDKKLRYEDALNAVKSALKTGILPGGGVALVVTDGRSIFSDLRYPGLAEIFLSQNIAGHLRPGCRHIYVSSRKDHGAIRIADLARRGSEFDLRVRTCPLHCKAAFDPHIFPQYRRMIAAP